MASDEDNFDIDVYGDIDEHHTTNDPVEDKHDSHMETAPTNHGYDGTHDSTAVTQSELSGEATESFDANTKTAAEDDFEIDVSGPVSTEAKLPEGQIEAPKQPPPKQGTKRKEGPDDRPTDNGATTAIFISDLHWWSTDDDIRGWINQSECEDELKDITFSEHKVNGKSKGQAFVEFTSPQAATAVKRKLESSGDAQQPGKRFAVTYTSANSNPYRTLPKDAPVRGKDGQRNQENRSSGGGYHSPGGMSNSPSQGSMNFGMNNFRGGGRGGFNRGGPMNNMGGYPNRGFSGPMGGGSPGGFQGGPMGGFPGPAMGGMPPYGGYPNRGGMMGGMRGGPMGNRGGRGGMGPSGMMTGMPGMGGMGGMMGGMPSSMGGMGGNMAMGPMGMQGRSRFTTITSTSSWPITATGLFFDNPVMPRLTHVTTTPSSIIPILPTFSSSPVPPPFLGSHQPFSLPFPGQPGGFQGPQPHFNPAFFNNQNQGVGGVGGDGGANWGNPHGTKRQRPE